MFGIADDFHQPTLISKSGENFLWIEITPKTKPEEKTSRLGSIDSFNFIGSSLDSLSESLENSNHTF